jgi:hypothetical protein
MMETVETEALEALEAQHATLKRRIASLADPCEKIVELIWGADSLTKRIEAAKIERAQADKERSRIEREQARTDLAKILPAAVEQREAFLAHYRAACMALGNYVELQTRAAHLTNQLMTYFGILPEDQNALQALQLGNRPREIIEGLAPDVDAGWQMSFPVTPMHEQIKRDA